MGELYRRVVSPLDGSTFQISTRYKPVGYTEDDVRRLAAAYQSVKKRVSWWDDRDDKVLVPFRALLDGGK